MCSDESEKVSKTNPQSWHLQPISRENLYIVNWYIRERIPDGEDRQTHLGIVIYKPGDTKGDIYHFRKSFGFFHHTQSHTVESTTLYGRREVIQFSNSHMLEAVRLLDVYGCKTLPQGKQNSHVWVLGASGAHERANLAPTGTAGYWQDQTGKGPIGIGKQLIDDGKPWVRKSTREPAQKS